MVLGPAADRITQPQKWRSWVEPSRALFECLEIFYNRRRRRSSLGMLTPVDYANFHQESATVA